MNVLIIEDSLLQGCDTVSVDVGCSKIWKECSVSETSEIPQPTTVRNIPDTYIIIKTSVKTKISRSLTFFAF